jgi:type IV pilus assembly protein PilC
MAQMTFAYKVRDTQGKLLEGSLDADSQALVASRLREMGYTPIDIRAKNTGGVNKELHIPGFGGRVPMKEVALFSRQFATLISSGLTLIRALAILTDQTENAALAKIVVDVRGQVERGVSLSQALGSHPKAFNRLFVAMVRAGEASGGLDQSLLTLAAMLESQVALRSKIKSAMAYPVAVLSLVLLIVAAIILFIVPIFKGIFKSLGGALPMPTQLLITVSNFAVKGAIPILVVAVLVVIGFRRWIRTEQGRSLWHITLLKLPIFGGLVRKTAVARFCSTFSSLLKAGVPILESLDITKDTANNVVVARAVDSMADGIRRGEPIAARLQSQPIFPTMVAQMMAVGEETGALDAMLGKAATFLEDEIARLVDSLTSLLEPLLIVVLGGTVGSMVICLYLPMFKVDTLINGGGSGGSGGS